MTVEQRRFYTPDEISSELLQGIVDESVPRYQGIYDFIDPVFNESDDIRMRVIIQQDDEAAPLVGFADRTPLTKGLLAEEKYVSPAHIKAGYPFTLKSPHLMLGASGTPSLSGEGLAIAVRKLERDRITRITQMWLTAINESVFTYADEGGIRLTIPYTSEIGDLTDTTTDIDNSAVQMYLEYGAMKEEYYEANGVVPDVLLCSGTTYNMIKSTQEVYQTIRPQTTRDPDLSGQSFETFMFDDILHVPARGKYLLPDGTLAGPLTDGLGFVFNAEALEDGRRLLRWNKANNKLNHGNAARPYYDVLVASLDPASVIVRMYDNGIPTIGKRSGMMKWDMYTPS